jgi:integrase
MRGSMREYQGRPGVWRLKVVDGYDAAGRPHQLTKTFKGTKRQAESALATFVHEVESGNAPVGGDTTVAQLLDRWMEHQQGRLSPTTMRGYADKIRRINPALGRIRLSKLTVQDLDRTYRAWSAEGLAPATVRAYHAVLSSAFNQAVRWGVIPRAVTDRASPPTVRTKAPITVGSDLVSRLIAAAEGDDPILATAIALGALTGARRGELCGLRWSDLDRSQATLWIRRAAKNGPDYELVIGPTKTHAERKISLDSVALEVLDAHRRWVEARAVTFSVALATDPYLLSLDPAGAKPMKPNSLGQAFRRLCNREGVTGVRLHDLRHFNATMMIGAGLDARTVASRLGHANPSITLRVYAGALEARDRQAAEVLGALLDRRAPAKS